MSLVRSVPYGYGERFLNYCQAKAKKQVESNSDSWVFEKFEFLKDERTIEILLTALVMFLCLKPVKMVATLKLTQVCFSRKQAKGVIDKAVLSEKKSVVRKRARASYDLRASKSRAKYQSFRAKSKTRYQKLRSAPRLRRRGKKNSDEAKK